MKKGKLVNCLNCKKLVYKKPCHTKRDKLFCTLKCYNNYQKRNKVSFKCCVCGKEGIANAFRARVAKTCSRACMGKLKTSDALEKHKLGIYTKHQIDRNLRYSKAMDDWRKSIFARDNYTCVWCGIRGSYLEADHVKPFAFFPELRFELSNGRTLCKPCHNKTKIPASAMRKIYIQNEA